MASVLALPFLRRQIFLPALLYERATSPVPLETRYRRWSTPLLPPLPWGWALAIFFLSETNPFSFAILRLLILREESRWVSFPASQKPAVFFSICLSTLLLTGSEIFLVSGTAKPRFARIHRAGFFLRPRPVRGGDCRRLRRRRAQLRAKCESAPLRPTVTERATRSTQSLKKVKKGNNPFLFNVFNFLTPNSSVQAPPRQAQPRAFFRLRGEEWRLTYRPARARDRSDTST